ncbi:UNVERIFIED_CONTAM: hypothetical protein K2H54_004814 [Gekko kuhli]
MEVAWVVQSRSRSAVLTPIWVNRRAWVWNDGTQGTPPIDIDAAHAKGIWIEDKIMKVQSRSIASPKGGQSQHRGGGSVEVEEASFGAEYLEEDGPTSDADFGQ